MIKKCLLIFLLFFSILSFAQHSNQYDILEKQAYIEVPFTYKNDFIIIHVRLNNLPLKFILDTGAEHTLLTQKMVGDLLNLKYLREFTVLGSDLETELTAYLVNGVSLHTGRMGIENVSMLVLKEDYFNFQELVGEDVSGILGADILRRFVIKLDYYRGIATFYSPSKFKMNNKNYNTIPVEFINYRPFLNLDVLLAQDTTHTNLKLLMDTGAAVALMLNPQSSDKLHIPPNVIQTNIGIGLGGFILGYTGRVNELFLGPYLLKDVVTNFQDFNNLSEEVSQRVGRNGILGNVILSRYTVILDYYHQKLYLKPNRNYKKDFDYDKSGLNLVSSGTNHKIFTVAFVVPGSPGEEAGIKIGDQIYSINGLSATFYDLDLISKKFKKRSGKKFKLKVKRGEEIFKVGMVLRDLI